MRTGTGQPDAANLDLRIACQLVGVDDPDTGNAFKR